MLSDGIKDGVVLMYAKNGVLYPVALSDEQMNILNLTIPLGLDGKLKVVFDKPQGNIMNLKDEV